MKYVGTDEELVDLGFEYVEEFGAYVRHCKYTRDGELYEDIFCVERNTRLVCVEIPKYCTVDVYKEVAADLIKKELLFEEVGPGPETVTSVRAKFYCTKNNKIDDYQEAYVVVFSPVVSGNEENEKFYKSTPYGEMVLGGVSKEVSDQFVIGAEYYFDITAVAVDKTVGIDFGTSPSLTANCMPRNIMTSEDGKTFYGRYDQFVDKNDFAGEVLNQELTDPVTDPVEVFMRPATPAELKELGVDEWFYEMQPLDLDENATRYYKAEAYDPGAE